MGWHEHVGILVRDFFPVILFDGLLRKSHFFLFGFGSFGVSAGLILFKRTLVRVLYIFEIVRTFWFLPKRPFFYVNLNFRFSLIGFY